MLDTESIALI